MLTVSALCLAMAVYYEARSESRDAQMAVAEVILNRVNSPKFPNTICEVVKQDKGPKAYDCQFSFYCDGKPERMLEAEAWYIAQVISLNAMEDRNRLGLTSMWYHAQECDPEWNKKLKFDDKIGAHLFYSEQ